MITKLIGVILILATVAAGIYVDIVWLLVGGITEIILGIEAHPVSGSLIGWGAAHLLFTGIGLTMAVVLCLLWGGVFFGTPARRRTRTTGIRR